MINAEFMDIKTKIGVLGAGIEGVALIGYLLSHGFEDVTLFDEKESVDIDVPKEVNKVFGVDSLQKIDDMDVLFRSPGIHPSKLKEVRGKGISVTSTVQYFMENCKGKVIGVTGTKGKGTTSALIHLILKEDGHDAYLGGNIGQSPLNFIDDLGPDSWTVLELSSFQLMDLSMSPHVAVILMTTSEHLDYHKDREEYLEAKASIAKFQGKDGLFVLNCDYDSIEHYVALGEGEKLTVSRRGSVLNGAYIEDGKVYFVKVESEPEEICDVEKVALPGSHNLENVLAAVAVTRALGVSILAIQKVVYSFTGLPHRLEFVHEVDGVKYYNDSFSTTPETSIAAVYAFKGPVILIAGGSEKHSDFSEWAMKLQANENLKIVILMGTGSVTDRMEAELKKAASELEGVSRMGEFPLKVYRCSSLEESIDLARINALRGDTVVMSPAAASFDLFKNYKERGKRFREIVNHL